MKLSFWSALAITLWTTIAQTEVLSNPSWPGSAIPVDPEDRPLLSMPRNHSLSATALGAGTPGPFLPNVNDPTKLSPTFPTWGESPSPFAGE
jgi:hypothetical protein